MPQYTSSEEAAAILIRTFEALARQNHKTLSQKTRADVARACELLATGDDYDELLIDLLEQPPIRSDRQTVSFERENYYGATDDPEFVARLGRARDAEWGRNQRREDAQR